MLNIAEIMSLNERQVNSITRMSLNRDAILMLLL